MLVDCPNNRFRTKVCGGGAPREPPAPGVDHFIYNYTIKANGTHAMEITFLQDAQMWPHLTDCGFIQGIIVSSDIKLLSTAISFPSSAY